MPQSLVPLIRALLEDPGAGLRLNGLRWYEGSGAPSRTEPLGLAGGRFSFVAGVEAPALDLSGWTLLPGLCDAHFHLWHEARRGLRVRLGGMKRRAEIPERLRQASGEGPVIGVDWDESLWDEPRFPTRRELDDWVPERPACLIRVCGHVAVLNSKALALMDPALTHLDWDSGLAGEQAVWAAARRFPPDPAALRAELGAVARRLASEGLTAVTEMGCESLPERAAALPDDFPLRIDYFHSGPVSELPARLPDPGPGSGRPRALGRKFFLDGSIGGKSAAVSQPYAEGGRGELLWEDAALCQALAEVFTAGRRVALHAIGDRAVEQALRCLAWVRPEPGWARLEHAEMASPEQLRRLAGLGVSVCLQPNFMDPWGRPGGLYEQRLGSGCLAGFATPGQAREAGLRPAYGTDGMPADLWRALGNAVDPALFGAGADTPEQALAAVTADAAAAAGRSGAGGRVAPGLAADFCLLPRDPVAENFQEAVPVGLCALSGRLTWIHPDWQGR